MPKSNHIHKSMLLRGVKFPPPALNAADVEATKGRAARSGRSNAGVPLQGDGRRNNGINYGASSRGNYNNLHHNNTTNGRNSWQPPPPGMGGFGQGPPPPPPPGVYNNYGRGPPGQAQYGAQYGNNQPRGPPPGYDGSTRREVDAYGRDIDRNGNNHGSYGNQNQQNSYRGGGGGGNFYRGR